MGLITDLPIFYSLGCIVFAFFGAYFLYTKDKLIQNKYLLVTFFLLRFFFLALLTLLLLNPVVRSESKEIENPIIILAQDISSSMSDNDSTLNVLNKIEEEFTDFDIHKLSFSDEVNSGFSTTNDGLKTNYGNLFSEVSSRFLNRNIAGLVLASDGLCNVGLDPLYISNIEYPIYSIAFGDTNRVKDVKVLRVRHNEIAFLGNKFPIDVSLSMQKVKGEKIDVSIFNKGVKLYSEKINIQSNDEYKKIQVLLEAKDIGLQKYKIVSSVIDGERNVINNAYSVYVDVIDSRFKILFLNSLSHPDIAAYKSVIDKNKNYIVESFHIDDFKGNLEGYQLLVLFGIDKNNFLIEKIKNSKIPLIVYELNKLGLKQELTSAMNFSPKGGVEDVGAVKSENFSKFTFSDNLLNFLATAPPLSTPFGIYNINNNAEFVLQQKIGENISSRPLVTLCENEGRKIVFVTAEGFWRWKLFDYLYNENNNNFDEFFSKLTQYLVLQEDKSRFRIDYERQYTEQEDIYFEASLFNKSFERIINKEISMLITNSDGDKYNFDFSPNNTYYTLDIGKLDVGQYSFHARVIGEELNKKGKFEVKPIQLEKINTVADHKLLSSLSKNSDGEIFYSNMLDDLYKKIRNHESNHKVIHIKEKMQGLINIPWILLILLSLISLEWFLRKYNGLI